MNEFMRCPACRGMKDVPKLGGMIGPCNMCSGKGTILASDKPKRVEPVIADDVNQIRESLEHVVPVSPVNDVSDVPVQDETSSTVSYKRKKGERK